MAPSSPSDAAASVKEAAKGAKDLVPDNVSDAATAASKAANSFSGFFGGAQKCMTLGLRDLLVALAGWWFSKDIIVNKCAYRHAAAKEKAEDVAPSSPSDAAASVKEAAKGAKDLVPDNKSDAATAASKATNSFSGFFGGAQKVHDVGSPRLASFFNRMVVLPRCK